MYSSMHAIIEIPKVPPRVPHRLQQDMSLESNYLVRTILLENA